MVTTVLRISGGWAFLLILTALFLGWGVSAIMDLFDPPKPPPPTSPADQREIDTLREELVEMTTRAWYTGHKAGRAGVPAPACGRCTTDHPVTPGQVWVQCPTCGQGWTPR